MNGQPTLETLFPLLPHIESAPDDMCRDAYHWMDNHWNGDSVVCLYKAAGVAPSTRHVLETLWPGIVEQMHRHDSRYYQILMYGLEFMRRLQNGTVTTNQK